MGYLYPVTGQGTLVESMVEERAAATPLSLSDDGTTLFYADAGVRRADIRTGRATGSESISIALQKGKPPRVASRTMSQGFGGLPSSDLIFIGHGPTDYAGALDRDHLLVASGPHNAATQRTYIAVSEIDFGARGAKPNRDWLLAPPGGSMLVGLQYANATMVEAWTSEPGAWPQRTLVRYTARRDRSGIAFRRGATFPWPSNIASIVSTSYEPLSGTFLFAERAESRATSLKAVSLSGKVKATKPGLLHSLPYPHTDAEWAMRVSESAVPGGKAAWQPLAVSSNRRYWFLRRKADGKLFELQIRPG